MSTATIQIIANVVQTLLLALLAALVKVWSDRQNANHAATNKKIDVLQEQTDGKLDKLLDAKVGQATAEGNLKGRLQARAEAKEDANP